MGITTIPTTQTIKWNPHLPPQCRPWYIINGSHQYKHIWSAYCVPGDGLSRPRKQFLLHEASWQVVFDSPELTPWGWSGSMKASLRGWGRGVGGGRCQLASRYLHQLPKAPNKCNPKKSVCLLSKAVSKEVVYPLLTRMFKLFSLWVETSRYWLLALGRKELGFLLGSPHWTGPPQVSLT